MTLIRERKKRTYVKKTKKEYKEGFDKFIKAKIREGTIYLRMNDTVLSERLKELQIRKIRYFDDETKGYITINSYPTIRQKEYVKDIIRENANLSPVEQRITEEREKRNLSTKKLINMKKQKQLDDDDYL